MTITELLGFSWRRERAPARNTTAARKLLGLSRELLAEKGEVSAHHAATGIFSAYESLTPEDRESFFDLLIKNFSPDPATLRRVAAEYSHDPSSANLISLQEAVDPPRRELFRRLIVAPGGAKVLLDMRSQVLHGLDQHPHWKPIAAELADLFLPFFIRGLLALRRIDWSTPATTLEKLMRYEAVHEIQGWSDLRRRLEADRRCYGFFHPVLPDEPIIFIETALTRGMSQKVQPLIDPQSPVTAPSSADCAVFYSITNCQDGLRGIPLGSFLIKQVVEDLREEFPGLRRFATLSPVPAFRKWLSELPSAPPLTALDQARWFEDKALNAQMQAYLMPLCAHYLLHAKQGREPLDPVARFHLRNGATLERLNWLGDTSETGMRRSAGIMANYIYRLDEIERNQERYSRMHRVIASHEIESAAKRCSLASRNGHPATGTPDSAPGSAAKITTPGPAKDSGLAPQSRPGS